MKEESKFKEIDFIPIVGLLGYINRNKTDTTDYLVTKVYKESCLKAKALFLYNIAVGTGILYGLEALLQ